MWRSIHVRDVWRINISAQHANECAACYLHSAHCARAVSIRCRPLYLPEAAPAGEPRELAPCTGLISAGDDIVSLSAKLTTFLFGYVRGAVKTNGFSCTPPW